MNMIRNAVRLNRCKDTELAITKLDVLGGIKKIKICDSYYLDGKIIKHVPVVEDWKRCEPIYKEFDGWDNLSEKKWHSIAKNKGMGMPKEMGKYIDYIQEETGVGIYLVSVGADREDAIIF